MSGQDAPAVVIVAYGPPDDLVECLTWLDAPPTHVLIVDNGRSDDVRAVAIRHGYGYVRPPRNVGFAAGVNLGLARIRADQDVLLLNPDARLLWRDVLTLQQAAHSAPRIAAVAPLLVGDDGASQTVLWPRPTPWLPWLGAVGLAGRWRRSGFLAGAVLFLRADARSAVGLLDERFFLYAEEADWQERARRLGWQVRVVPGVVASHRGAGASGDEVDRMERFHASQEAYIRKWYGAVGWTAFRPGAALAAARRSLTARHRDTRRIERRVAVRYLRGR